MPDHKDILLRIPGALVAPLVAEADKRDVSLQTVVLESLSKRFKVKVEPLKVGRPLKS